MVFLFFYPTHGRPLPLRPPPHKKRKFALRTFAVLPMTEDCALIEWVPNTSGFRPAVKNYVDCTFAEAMQVCPDVKKKHTHIRTQMEGGGG